MLLELLPSQLYQSPKVRVLLRHNASSILHKVLGEDLIDKEMYLANVAMLFVIQGRQIIRSYSGKQRVVESGELLYLSKDMYLVSDFVTQYNEFEALLFFFDDEFIERYRQPTHPSDRPSDTQVLAASSQINSYMQSLLSVYLSTHNSPRLLDLKLAELLEIIKLQNGGDDFLAQFSAFPQSAEKRDIRQFMSKNVLRNLRVEDYAALTGRSKSTFSREFKRLYNTSPNQWLIEQRLNKAQQLLMSTEMNVTTIAFEVGYENVSHFIDAYKKKFNTTPKRSKNDTLTQISY